MVSVRLVCAETYQAVPIPGLDPTYSEFRGSEVKHVPIIRIFGSTSNGEKTCLHIHGVFPYMYIPYTGGEESHSMAYRLATSLDTAINVSLGSASCHNQHVFKIQLISGIPFYGYHEKEHQFFKVYFYNPAMIKRAANLLQNGSVLNGSLQPYEAHIPFIQQFMIDFNLHGMNMVDLQNVKHRMPSITLSDQDINSEKNSLELDNVDYLPETVLRQTTCKLEIDALASDILNRREIESELALNPGLATIWEEEKARRLKLNLSGGDSQLVDPKSPTRPFVVTENDIFQQQRLANRLLTLSQQSDDSFSISVPKTASLYPLETDKEHNLLNASHLEHHIGSCSKQSHTAVFKKQNDVENSILMPNLSLSATPCSRQSLDCSILDVDDIPLINLLNELAFENANENVIDDNSQLGSQNVEVAVESKCDSDSDEVEDLNLTSLQLDSLSLSQHSRLSQKSGNSKTNSDQRSVLLGNLSVFDMDTDLSSEGSICDNIPQYDGAGDILPVLKTDKKEANSAVLNHSLTKRLSNEIISMEGSCASQYQKVSRLQIPSCSTNTQYEIDFDLDLPSTLPQDHYLDGSHGIFNEQFTQLSEEDANFDSDLENLQSTMEIDLLSPNTGEIAELNNQSTEDRDISINKVLTGDPCFTESAVFDKSDITELQDQYVSLLGNALLTPSIHGEPCIDLMNTRVTETAETASTEELEKRKCAMTTKLIQNSIDNRNILPLENITPNIQNLNNQMQTTIRANLENCKDQEDRLTPPDSDYNCNVVATWEELQNLRFVDKQSNRKKGQKKNESESVTNRSSDTAKSGSKRLRIRREINSLPYLAHQKDTHLHVGKYSQNENVKLSTEEKNYTDVETVRNNVNRKVYTRNKFSEINLINARKNQSYSSYKFYRSKKFIENKLNKCKAIDLYDLPQDDSNVGNDVSTRQHELEELSDIFDINAHTLEDVRCTLSGVHYSLHPLNKNQTLVDSILADFKADDEIEFSANVDESFSETTSNASTYISYYSCKHSHHNVAEKKLTHSHAMINSRGKIVPQSVYSPNNLWVIEKRKVGKPRLPRQNCQNITCKLPTILIKKLNVDGICNGLNIKQTSKIRKNNEKLIENAKSINICYTDRALVQNRKNFDSNLKTSPTNDKQKSSPKSRLFCEFDEESNDNSFITSEESKHEIQEFSSRRITRISRLKHEQITKNLFPKCSSSNESNCTIGHIELDTSNSSAMTNEVTSDAALGEEGKIVQTTMPITRLKTPIIRGLLPSRKMNGLKKGKAKLVVLTLKNNSLPKGNTPQHVPNGKAITGDHAALSTSKHDCNVQDQGKDSSTHENSRFNVNTHLSASDMINVTEDKVAEQNSTWNDLVQPTIAHSSTLNTDSIFVQKTVGENDSYNLISNLSHHATPETQLGTKPDAVDTENKNSDKTSTLHKLKILLEKRIDDKLIDVSSEPSLLHSLLSQGQNDDQCELKNCNRKSSKMKLKNYLNHSDRYSLDSGNFTPLATDPRTTDQMGDQITESPYDNMTSKPGAVNSNAHDETVDTFVNVNDLIFNENDSSNRPLSTFTETFVYEPAISDALPSASIDTFSSSMLDSCTQVMQTLDSSCIAESRPTTEAGLEELISENHTNLEFTEHNLLNDDGKTCFSPSREYAVDVITSEIPKCLFEEDSSSDEDENSMKKDEMITAEVTQVEGCDASCNESVDCLPDHQNLDVFDIDNLISDTITSDNAVDIFRPATSEEELQNKNSETSKENISDDTSDSIEQVLRRNSNLEDNDMVCDTATAVVDSESNNNVIIDVSNENVAEFENCTTNEITEKNTKDNLVSLVNNEDRDNTAFTTAYEEKIESEHLISDQITDTESTEDEILSTKISDAIDILEEINLQSSHLYSDMKKVDDAANNVQCEKYPPEPVLNVNIDTNSNSTDKSTDSNDTQSTAEKVIEVTCPVEKQVNIDSQEQVFNPQNKAITKTCFSDQDITNETSCSPCCNDEEKRKATPHDIDKKLKLVSIQLEKIDISKLSCLVKSSTNADKVQLPRETNDIELKIGSSHGNSRAEENTCLSPSKSKSNKRVRFDDNIILISEACQVGSSLNESSKLLPSPPKNNSERKLRNMPNLLQPRRESIRMKNLSSLPNEKTQYTVNSSIIARTCSSGDRTSHNDEALNDALENFSSTYQETNHKRMNSRSLSIVKCLEKYDKKVQIIKPDPKLLVVKIKCNETRWVNRSRKQRFMARLGLYRTDSSNLIFCSKPPATAFVQLKIPKVVLKRLDSSMIKQYETSKTGDRKRIMGKHHGRSSICRFQIPACDGAADGSSSDSEQEQDLTLERHEKRICDYKSYTKRSPLRLIDLAAKKRNCTSENYRVENSSKKRRTNCASPKQLNDSQKMSDLLNSPGCPSRSYSPLNIIVSSPQKRNDVRTSSSQPSEPQEEISEPASITPRRKLRQPRERVLRDNSSIRSPQSKDGNKKPNNDLEGPDVFGELHAIPSTSGAITAKKTTNDLITSTIFRKISCDDTGMTTRSSDDARKRLVFTFHKENRTEESPTMYISGNDDNTLTNEQPRYLDNVGATCIGQKLGSKVRNIERNIGNCQQGSSGRSVGIAVNKSSDKLTLDVMANCNYFEEDDDTAANDLSENDQSTTLQIERQKLVCKDNEMQNSDDEELNLCNITFTQYIESQRTENVQYFSSVGNYNKTQRNIVIRPRFNPPRRQEITETMELFGIPSCRNEKPFFGDHKDVMSEKEVAHQMLKVPSKSVLNLPLFKSELECITGIRRWRMMKVKEVYPAGAKLKSSEMKQNLTGQNKIIIKPLTNPPTLKSVKTWLRAKQYLKQQIENKNISEETKNSAVTCTPQSESSSTPNSDTIETFNPSSSSQISKPDGSIRSELAEKTNKRCLVKGKFSETETKVCARRFSTSSRETNESNISIDASLQNALQNSNLYKDQDPSRHFAVTFGQIETSSQADNFKIPCQNLQELKPITTHQFLTILCLEVHTVTRGDLLPNPQYDAISAIFYAVQNDVPETSNVKPLEHGIIVLDPQFDASKTRGYLKGAAITCPVVYSVNEEALFENLVSLILKCDPDILIGWELEFLSWGYVFQRAAVLGINLAPRVSRIPTTKQAWENQTTELNILTEIKMPGRIVLDIWRLMRHELGFASASVVRVFIPDFHDVQSVFFTPTALQSYTFENVTYHVMHQRISSPAFATLTRWWGHRTPRIRWMVVDHYINKVLGILKLLDHLDIIGKTSELARIYGIQFFEVFSRGSQFQVESVMLRLAKPSNYVPISPSVQQRATMRAPESLPLIMEPESVFYSDPLIVLDFQSLYPSIIIAHNYCYSTCLGRIENIGQPDPFEFGAATLKVTKRTASKLSGKVNFSPCGVAFVKPEVRQGILPRMLMEMIETRLMVKKAMKDHSKTDKALQRALFSRQLGLKLLANVTFGYTHANFSGRMPCIEIGDSIVSKARETLERAIHLVEANKKWNARVVYGDTDSLFLVVPGKSRKQAFQIGAEIAAAVTADNPTPMKLKLEKIMHPAILQTKKRYCGYMYESPDQEIPVYLAKGIETVRRDGCPAVSKILEKTLRILFNTKDVSLVKSYVIRQLDKVLRGRVSLQDLTFAREFRGLQGYKATACVPALELTQRLIQKDPRAIPRTSERVPYIIVAGAPNQPLFQCVKSPWEVLMDPGLRPNALYYITRVIIPPLNRCLNLLGVDVNVWFSEMPHRYIANYATALRTNVQKSTISQYFGTVACAACGNNSKAGICTDCLTLPNQTLVVLHEKIRQMERTCSSIHAVCQSCIGRADNIDCASLDCPILYRRLKTTNDHHQINYIRQIIDKGNSLEF